MISSKKNFCGIVVLEPDLVGKLEPKCDHNFSIPSRLKQKSATQFQSVAYQLSFRIYVFQNFEMKQMAPICKKNEFFCLFSIVHLVIKVRKMKIKKIRFFETHKVEVPFKKVPKKCTRNSFFSNGIFKQQSYG